ncbi:MAG: hypothetical protein AAGC84_06140 [Pseudomonas sp.]
MRALISLMIFCALTGCSSSPEKLFEKQVLKSQTPLARTPREAIKYSNAVPMPTNPGLLPPQWKITAAEPRILIKGVPSNYRIFSVDLQRDVSFHINVNSWCVNACLGFSKYALNPYLILLDAQGNLVAEGYGRVTGYVGAINQELIGVVKNSGAYYLVVAADNKSPGKTVIIDNILMVGSSASPIAPMRIDMKSYPFGSVGPFLSTEK